MAESIGSFLANLSMKVDQASFNNAMKYLKSTATSIGSFGKGVFDAGQDLIAFAQKMQDVKQQNILTAISLNSSFYAVMKLKKAFELTGNSGEDLVSSLRGLRDFQINLTKGQVDQEKLFAAGRAGFDINKLLTEKDPTKLFRDIMKHAVTDTKHSTDEIQSYLRDMLGTAGEQQYLYFKEGKITLEQLLSEVEMYVPDKEGTELKTMRERKKAEFGIESAQMAFAEGFLNKFYAKLDLNRVLTKEGLEDFKKSFKEIGASLGGAMGKITANLATVLNPLVKALEKLTDVILDEKISLTPAQKAQNEMIQTLEYTKRLSPDMQKKYLENMKMGYFTPEYYAKQYGLSQKDTELLVNVWNKTTDSNVSVTKKSNSPQDYIKGAGNYLRLK